MKRVLKYAGFGFLLGVAICNVITTLTGDPLPVAPGFQESIGSLKGALLIQSLLSGLYGAICMGTVLVYDDDRLSLSLSSLIHCLCCIIPFIPLSLFLRWGNGIADVMIMAGFQLAAYFVVWFIMFIRYKKVTEELNEIQKNIVNKSNMEDDNK